MKSDKKDEFIGEVEIYNEKIYIDTRNGLGYSKLLQKFEKFINYMALKYDIIGQDSEDMRQNMIVYILEGILKYDPTRGTKLSTFLQMRINRRLINEIRNQNLDSRNPTILRTTLYSVNCSCGNHFTMSLGKDDDIKDYQCFECKNLLEDARIYAINKPPVFLDSMKIPNDKTIDDVLSDTNSDLCLVSGVKRGFDEEIESKHDLQKVFSKQDKKFQQILHTICFEDKSIQHAAQEAGMSCSGATNKIKKLRRNKTLSDILRRKWKK
jgi:RNA polymerase sigma factor (sigma-70 family)